MKRKKKLKKKLCEYLKRGKAIARPLVVTIKRVNEIVRGWINYFRIGLMKQFVEELGQWLRHKIRMIVMKQWKKPKTIYRNLSYLNWKNRNGYSQEDIHTGGNQLANLVMEFWRRTNSLWEKLGRYTVLTTSIRTVSTWELFLKRLIDILGGIVGCILTGILFRDPCTDDLS